ncbi:MAG: large conductance mechanosensitive channel protein MscL, partial [Clostridiales bacterium]|nr:large conductance mechanosensitive channel protein MscL [Clostridiales bacterium]
ITRGNVVDLAVGMIIGAAFTAIVTALVNGVFKPLINAIPMGDVTGLITMLRPAYMIDETTGKTVIDMANSVYINWGDFIMAIVNFLITAIVLFLIIKAINTFRTNAEKLKGVEIDKQTKAELKAQGMNKKQMVEYLAKKAEEEAAQKAAEDAANAPETTEHILSEIRELLKSLQK